MQAFLGRSSCTLFYVYQMSKLLYSVFSLLPSAFFPSLFPSSFTPSLIPSSSYTLPFFYLHSSLLPSLLPSFPYTLPFFSVDSFLLPLLFSHMSKAIFLMSVHVYEYKLFTARHTLCCLHVLSVWVRPPQCTTVVQHSQEA